MSRVVVVTTQGHGSLASYSRALARATRAPVLEVHGCSGSFGHRLLSVHSARRAAADLGVVRELRRVRAPLLHLTSHHLARYGPLTGTPYVVTVHDLMRHRDWRERDSGVPLIAEPNARDRLHLRLDAAGLRRARALIAVSEHTKRELVHLLGVAPESVHVVPEGVDREAFRRVPGRLVHEPYVLYVGSEQPRKNLGTLLEAFMRLRRHTGMSDLKLVKVGAAGGPEGPFRESTLAHARATGALPHLVFADRVDHDDLLAAYSGALCLVQPSRHEGFGLPPLEAMACGCPVVVSGGGALPEVAGAAGVVYGEPEDAHALTAALLRVVSSGDERSRLAQAGLERAAVMSWARTAERTHAVWRVALGERSRQPLTSIRRGRFCSGFGTRTVSTPSSSEASMASGLAPPGRVIR